MLTEKVLEDILVKYPELIEDGLILLGRQVFVFGRRIDLLFEDKFKRKLIVELKNGPIKDENVGQIMSYEGMILSDEDPSVRVMLVGTRVPPNIQRSLDHHGIAWKEISHSKFKEILMMNNEVNLLKLFNNESFTMPIIKIKEGQQIKEIKSPTSSPILSNSSIIGLKIYKGSSSTNNNINVSLAKNIELDHIDGIQNASIKECLRELRNLQTPIYAWAGLARIQKEISYGTKIIFIIVDTKECYILEYLAAIHDETSEFQKYIHWLGKGFANVVFMKNKQIVNLSDNQIDKILKLADAEYKSYGGFAGYKYTPILYSENVEKLITILNTKNGG